MAASRRKSFRSQCLLLAPALLLAVPAPASSQVALASNTRVAADPEPAVTYAGDVALILQENCQVCHQEGGIGPMALTSYEEVRPWGPVIKLAVQAREMPPYHYDTTVGIQDIKNDWRLTDAEIATIAAWVDSGMELGNPADMPPPAVWPDWNKFRLEDYFGRPPDVVVSSTPYDVPAVGSDIWWQPRVPSGLTEDRCIMGVETKPSFEGRSVSHHANTSFRVPSADSVADDGATDAGGRLSEYAMGKIGEIVPPDACRVAPANSNIAWDIHYYPNGEQVNDATVEVGIWLHPPDVKPKYMQDLRTYSTTSGSGDLEIPPQGTMMTEGYTVWDHPVRIDSWQPHGHLRLVGAKLEIMDPATGRKQLVSMVSNWNAGWHHSHVYEDDVAPLIPAGHILVRTQWYNNTDDNKYLQIFGGDPDMWVGTGDRTADEMSHQWIAVTHLDQAGYDALVAERAAAAGTEANPGAGTN